MPVPNYKKKLRGLPCYKGPGIYNIVCLANGRVYVGSATCVRGRLHAHRSCLRRGIADNKYLQRSWDKHGEGQFRFDLVEMLDEGCDEILLLEREKAWIVKLRTNERMYGYNLAEPGRSPMYGRNHSPESRAKMRESHKGHDTSKATKAAAEVNRGRKRTPEECAAISKGKKGIKKSAEHVAKIVATRRAEGSYGQTEEHRKAVSDAAKKRWEKYRLEKYGSAEMSPENRRREAKRQELLRLMKEQNG